ncbi:MAG TPA: BMP family ABC transporter substrate-binding protein [Aeromicrobium sp.]|nr:BMP family ABC transporter substrate-binding protein [Aeromicrobium sp.]
MLTPVDTLCKAATGDGPKVGIAYDVGGRNDRGINDAAFAGLSEAVDELEATCVEGEAADGEQESARVDRLRHFADNGATAIVAIGTRYARAVDTVSQSYPRIQFALIDATAPKRHFGRNVAVLNFDGEQIGFLAGVAAALKTKTGKVGFVGAPPDDVLERSEPYEAGFRAGVETASGGTSRADLARGTSVAPTPSTAGAADAPTTPTVEVLAKHLKRDTPAPGKPDGAKKTATALFEDDDVDVVFGSPGVSQRALFNAARGAGDEIWVVGVGADQFQSATEDQKPHILTSVVKRFDTVTYDFLESVAKDTPLTGRHTYGLDEDGIDFVTSGTFLTKRNIVVIDGFKDRVESGSIKVPDRLG